MIILAALTFLFITFIRERDEHWCMNSEKMIEKGKWW